MIICQVTGAAITVAQNELLTTGMVQAVPVRFRFSPQWAALDRTAVFTAGTVSVSCLLGEDNQCFIPWECLTRAGEYLRVGVYGTRGEEMVLPTVSCLLGPICTGTQPEENTPTEATPTLVQSLLTKAEAAVSVADALRTDADAGLFNGRDGKDGTNGKDGKDGQKGTPVRPARKGRKGKPGKPALKDQRATLVRPALRDRRATLVRPVLRDRRATLVKPALKDRRATLVKPALKDRKATPVRPALKGQKGKPGKPAPKGRRAIPAKLPLLWGASPLPLPDGVPRNPIPKPPLWPD